MGREFEFFCRALKTSNLLRNHVVPQNKGVLYLSNYLYCLYCPVQYSNNK